MYNSQKIFQLLKERKIRKNDFLESLGINPNASLAQYFNVDLKSSRLEAVADYFDLPIDYFFDREKDYPGSQSVNVAGNTNSRIRISQILEREKSLKSLCDEKEKRIQVLEEMNALLKDQLEILRAKESKN